MKCEFKVAYDLIDNPVGFNKGDDAHLGSALRGRGVRFPEGGHMKKTKLTTEEVEIYLRDHTPVESEGKRKQVSSANRFLTEAVIWGKCFFLLFCFLLLSACNDNPFSPELPSEVELPSEAVLTNLPCDSNEVLWMQPFGNVDHGGGNAFFHDGIDMGTVNRGKFFSSTAGIVKEVDLYTGTGWPGTNYRIVIQVARNVNLDYHFEIGGETSESKRKNNIYVSEGDWVEAGQHIANLIVVSKDVAHVHWGVYEPSGAEKCPLDYFTEAAAQRFEALYDSGIEKRPSSRPDLCE